MALDNAALAALRLGDVQRGTTLAQRAREAWSGEARTADEHLWVVQGAITNCQLLIKADRAEEAVSLARAAKAIAAASGLAQPSRSLRWPKPSAPLRLVRVEVMQSSS